MAHSRRSFMKWAASVSAVAVDGRRSVAPASLLAAPGDALRVGLPTQKEVWDQQVWMAGLGPKYTGNKAHTTFVEFLATALKRSGVDVARERYTLPRWEIAIAPASGAGFKVPVASYFPYA